jgi:cytochrome c oxidase subunit IV
MDPDRRKPPEEEAVPPDSQNEQTLAARKADYRQGAMVLVGLAVLTALEYVIAVILEGSVSLLFILVLAKAGLILQYYMHVNRVWSDEEAH